MFSTRLLFTREVSGKKLLYWEDGIVTDEFGVWEADLDNVEFNRAYHATLDTGGSMYKEVGYKHDDGKPDWSILGDLWLEVEEALCVLEAGAKKYSLNNWKSVRPFRARYLSALIRHAIAYARGEQLDQESHRQHMAHVIANALFLMWGDRNHITKETDV